MGVLGLATAALDAASSVAKLLNTKESNKYVDRLSELKASVRNVFEYWPDIDNAALEAILQEVNDAVVDLQNQTNVALASRG